MKDMEFKGTKGKWRWDIDEYYNHASVCSIGSGNICEINYTDENMSETPYNMALISKAPEMLDFINRISGEMLRNDFVLDEKWYEQAQELIKQATDT